MNLARLGAQATVIGFTGGDEDERLLARVLRADGDRAGVCRVGGFPTITKQRILGGRQQMLRLDNERLGDAAAAATMTGLLQLRWSTCRAAMRWCFPTTPRAC